MSIAFLADPHVGNFKAHGGAMVNGLNERGRMSLDTFRGAIKKAIELEVGALCIAGDLFQSRRPEPAVIAGVLTVLVEEARNLPVLIIPGNHDMLDTFAANRNTACQPLYREATIINTAQWVPIDGAMVYAVPFQSGEPMSEYLKREVGREHDIDDGQRILLTHVGVYDDASPPWCRSAKDAIHADVLFEAMAAGGFSLAFVGNYHNGRTWVDDDAEMKIVQCGTLCPHSHSDAGFFPTVGGLWVYGGMGDVTPYEVPGPRFYDTLEGRTVGVSDNGSMEVVAVEPLSTVTDRILAANLPQAKDAPNAITGYVDKMQLTDDVDRKAVRTAALDVWSKS